MSAASDIPVIFSAQMVRALLAGTKTQTRRLAWHIRKRPAGTACKHALDVCAECDAPKPTIWQKVKHGDRLYVRENFAFVGGSDPGILLYAATWQDDAIAAGCDRSSIEGLPPKWTPCIHMPRKISRLTLEVLATKIEPLQAITDDDARAEGCLGERGSNPDFSAEWDPTPAEEFCYLWRTLHGPASWIDNPQVVVPTFAVHKQNIDAFKRERGIA